MRSENAVESPKVIAPLQVSPEQQQTRLRLSAFLQVFYNFKNLQARTTDISSSSGTDCLNPTGFRDLVAVAIS